MKIAVFGATGGTGTQVVARALELGHEVTAFARRPEAIGITHQRLRVAQGDALIADQVSQAIAGQDAVICAIGPRKGAPPAGVISGATRNILAAMQQHGVRRLVFESGLMVGDGRGLGIVGRAMLSVFRTLNRALFEDKVVAERAIFESALAWTVVRPPNLSHGPATGSYRTGADLDVKLTRPVSHADVADFLLKIAADENLSGKVLDMSM